MSLILVIVVGFLIGVGFRVSWLEMGVGWLVVIGGIAISFGLATAIESLVDSIVFVKSLQLGDLMKFMQTAESVAGAQTAFLHSLSLSSSDYPKTVFCLQFQKLPEIGDLKIRIIVEQKYCFLECLELHWKVD